MTDREIIEENIGRVLTDIDLPWPRRSGKVREVFDRGDGTLVMVTTDRVSAFDRIVGAIPFKGQVLSAISNWWMRKVEHIVPTHLIQVPDPAAVIVRKLNPLPIEVIVRGYLTGSSPTSIWTHYAMGEREYCGHRLPDGMHRHQKLPQPIVTPTTKEHDGHDELTSALDIVGSGLVGRELYEQVERVALELFRLGSEEAARQGLILADTKYEFGTDDEGRLYLIDEIHTPDSSRYWYAEDYEERLSKGLDPRGLDKDTIRNYLKSQNYFGEEEPPVIPVHKIIEAAEKYLKLHEILTGQQLNPSTEEPVARIRRNLGLD